MGPGAHKNANQASESDWNTPKRGRSIKERITNAIGRSKSHGARPGPSSRRLSHGSINSDDEQELNIAKAKSGTEEDEHEDSYYSVPNQDANKPHPSTANGGVGSSTTVKAAPSGASKEPGHGLMRKLSRKETRAARQPDPAPPKPGEALPCPEDLHRCYKELTESSFLFFAAQSEIDKIRLYAAPDSAGVKNAPMLSSFPPRAPLRPRANTDAKDQPHEPQVPSMTVGDARLAYTKSLSRNNHRHRGGRPANSSNVAPPPYRKEGETLRPAVADEDVLSMRSARSRGSSTINGTRRSRAVPEGWATGESLLETQVCLFLLRICMDHRLIQRQFQEQGQKGTKVQFE